MTVNDRKQPDNDGLEPIDYEWEARKTANRILDVLTMIEGLAAKIRSNSGRLSRIQAELTRLRDIVEGEEGWEPEGGKERARTPIDLHAMSFKELEDALNRE